MNKIKLQQLSRLLDESIEQKEITVEEWLHKFDQRPSVPAEVIETESGCAIVLNSSEKDVQYIAVERLLNPLEGRLIVWALDQQATRNLGTLSETERQARQLGEWIVNKINAGESAAELNDRIELNKRLQDERIPFMLFCGQSEEKEPSYAELDKVVRSFLSEDTLLIPLREHEWLILSPVHVLSEAEPEDIEEVDLEDIKELLSSLAESLNELITSEWGGECHIAVDEPFMPAERLTRTVVMLRETIYLGRRFHVGTQVHLPWLTHLERLLNGIPEEIRVKFLSDMMSRPDLFADAETVSTLDAFFSMDCNVSETAKKLYIHRNTLLYRLDKIKHEAGLDVRSFNDAVLVRILLLLYKVTKRK